MIKVKPTIKVKGFFSLLSTRSEMDEAFVLGVKDILANNHMLTREKAHMIEELTDEYKLAIK